MRVRVLPTPSMVIATLALFIALAGSGFAASQIASSHRARARVTKAPTVKQQIKKAVAAYFASHKAQLRGPIGPKGPQGASGTNGINGTNGAPGANGTNGTNGAPGPPAQRISYSVALTQGTGSFQPVVTVDEMTISASCDTVGPGNETRVQLQLTSSASADVNGILSVSGSAPGAVDVYNTTGPVPLGLSVENGGIPGEIDAQFVFHDVSRVINVLLHAGADSADDPGHCRVYGTAIPSPS